MRSQMSLSAGGAPGRQRAAKPKLKEAPPTRAGGVLVGDAYEADP